MNAAFRDAFDVGLAQGHVNHVEAIVARYSFDVADETESGQHAMGVVVRSPADVRQHPRLGFSAERLGAEGNRRGLQLLRQTTDHQHFDFTPACGHGREVVLEHIDTSRGREVAEVGHAID